MADPDAAYLVGADGNYLVDDTGAYIVTGDVSGLPYPGAGSGNRLLTNEATATHMVPSYAVGSPKTLAQQSYYDTWN